MSENSGRSSKVLKRHIVTTEDGSSSFEIPEMNEMYHSRKGAIKESQHVYIDHGFCQSNANPINVLEIGMGTGLNVLLTLIAAKDDQRKTTYHTLEPYPLQSNEWQQLNFDQYLPLQREAIATLHSAVHGQSVWLNDVFECVVYHQKLEEVMLEGSYDVVYFDAFAPNKQANPWSLPNLEKVYNYLKPDGLLTTYCSQGQFKRNLASVGFQVTNPEGPMGKREITVAYKKG